MRDITEQIQELRDNPLLQTLYAFAKKRAVELYLVGGSVRDLFIYRPITDFDFTMKSDAIEFAKSFSERIKAPCIPLEENPPTARVIIKSSKHIPKEMSLDFAQFRSTTLEKDLRLRDLTINAMAIPLESLMESDQPEIIDPCNGRQDLADRKLLFPREKVIRDDPLRLIRLYRFAAELGFSPPYKSVMLVQENKNLLRQVSKERIRDEVLKMLNTRGSSHILHQMLEVGLFSRALRYLNWSTRIWRILNYFDSLPYSIALLHHQEKIETYLNEALGVNTYRMTLMKICLISKDSPENIGKQLCLSKRAVQFMKCIVKEYPQLASERLTKEQRIDFLRATGSDWLGVLIFRSYIDELPIMVTTQIACAYYHRIVPILKQGRLITGAELIEKFQLKEGKEVGRLLKQVEDLQFYGEIRTQEEAFAVVERLLNEGDAPHKSV